MVPIRVQVWYLYDSREDSTWKKHDRPEWAGSRPAVGARSDGEGGLLGEEEYRF